MHKADPPATSIRIFQIKSKSYNLMWPDYHGSFCTNVSQIKQRKYSQNRSCSIFNHACNRYTPSQIFVEGAWESYQKEKSWDVCFVSGVKDHTPVWFLGLLAREKRRGAFCPKVIVFLPPQISIIFLLAMPPLDPPTKSIKASPTSCSPPPSRPPNEETRPDGPKENDKDKTIRKHPETAIHLETWDLWTT